MNKPNHPAVMATDAVETWLAGASPGYPTGAATPVPAKPTTRREGDGGSLPPSGDRPVSLVSAHTLAPDGVSESANFSGVDAEPSATLTCSNIGIHDQA
jgi:hypothetical protein